MQIPIVALGTKDAYLAIRSDDQLENRFEPFILPRWEYNEEYLSLLSSVGNNPYATETGKSYSTCIS